MARETTTPEKPVLFMLDEFAQLGHMAIIENAASIVRDYKIRLWIILQNLPQLKALYGQKWESFLSSAGVIQFFTPNDLETAQYLEKRCGVIKEKRTSESFSNSTSTSSGSTATGPSSSSSTSSSHSKNISEAEVPFLPVHRAFELDQQEEILVCPNVSKGIIAARYPYWRLDFPIFMPDPYHQSSEERALFEQRARAGEWITKADLRQGLSNSARMQIEQEVNKIFPCTKEFLDTFKSQCTIKKAWFSKKVTVTFPDGKTEIFKDKSHFEFELSRRLQEETRQAARANRTKRIQKGLDVEAENLFNANAASLQLNDVKKDIKIDAAALRLEQWQKQRQRDNAILKKMIGPPKG